MYKNAFCPISERKVNTAVVRTHAILTVIILSAFLIVPNVYLPLLLLADFVVRVFNFPRLSILGIAARWIVKQFRINGKPENAGPKLFAARIGLIFTVFISVSFIAGNVSFAAGAALVLVFFSFLEGAFGICVACIIYPYVFRWFYRSRSSRIFIIRD